MPGATAGAWVNQRAEHILKNNPDLQDKGEKGRSIAYALAVQQGHRLNKTPKDFRTPAGVREAKDKYDKPRSEYVKTPDPVSKTASSPPPAIPTPQFPTGLAPVKPNSVSPIQLTAGGLGKATSAQSYTQVHTQPSAANLNPYTSGKSASPPQVK